MRRNGLILAPITALAALGVASPSLAADVPVTIEPQTFAFAPKTESVGVGDTVTWTFNDGNHTTTSLPGQPDKWNSGLEDQGGTFQKTFTTPGRYQYICIPHRDFMKGTIVVGSDTVKSTAGKLSAKVKGTKATISFKLNEAAVGTLKLSGAAKRTVKTKRLKAGKQSIVVKKLKQGSYKAALTLSDDFDNTSTKKKSFKVR
jgi:plastocyanin